MPPHKGASIDWTASLHHVRKVPYGCVWPELDTHCSGVLHEVDVLCIHLVALWRTADTNKPLTNCELKAAHLKTTFTTLTCHCQNTVNFRFSSAMETVGSITFFQVPEFQEASCMFTENLHNELQLSQSVLRGNESYLPWDTFFL